MNTPVNGIKGGKSKNDFNLVKVMDPIEFIK